MLASDILNRAWSQWLFPGGRNLPAYDILDSNITDSATSFDVRGELDDIPSDTTVEIDSELILTGDVTADTPSAGKNRVAVVQRGWGGSTAAAHTGGATGARVYVEQPFPRAHMLNALRALVDGLYSDGVYKRKTYASLTFSYGDAAALPSDLKRLIAIEVQNGTGVRYKPLEDGRHYRILKAFSPYKIQFSFGGSSGRTIQLVYAADYDGDLIVNEAFDLSDATLDVPMDIQKHLPMAVAGYMLQGQEISRINIEDIRSAIAAAGAQVPVGSSLNVGQSLLAAFQQLAVAKQRRELMETDPPETTWVF